MTTLYKAMPTMPVSDLRTHQAEIIATLDNTPIMLTNRGEGAGVLVHPNTWNKLVEEVERYRRLARFNQIRHNMDAGNYLTEEQAKADLSEREAVR
jgi:PHD/YefM family antitoxin component YafN of YafNO toxin-antitoxin module